MLDFLRDNLGTIIVAVIIAAAVAGVVFRLVRRKKKGEGTCGCGCGGCSMNGTCHPDVKKDK